MIGIFIFAMALGTVSRRAVLIARECSGVLGTLFALSLSASALLLDEGGRVVRAVIRAVVIHHELHHVLQLEGVPINCRLHVLLLLGPLDNLFLDRITSDNPIDSHWLGLADSVRPIRRLFIHGRVPIVIVEDHSVSGDQVYAEAASSCRKEEGKDVVIALVFFDHVPPILNRGLTVQPEEGHLLPRQEVLEDVQHACHLAEDEAAVLLCIQSIDQIGKYAHLCTVSD